MSESNPKDQRRLPDRRQRATLPLSLHSFVGRRHGPRRREERGQNYYVDRYPPLILGVIVTVLALCILDAVLTLHLIKLGAQEVNPVMRHFLSHGPAVFLIVKYVLTCSALVLLLLHKNFFIWRRKLRADFVFFATLILYVLLVGYELLLIVRM